MSGPLPLCQFDYELPAARIAAEPARPRDASRLMVVPRRGGEPEHQRFSELPEWLDPGDVLVVNRTRVIPARLRVSKPTGGRVELLAFKPLCGTVENACRWLALARPAAALRSGLVVTSTDGTALRITGRQGDGVVLESDAPLVELLCRVGEVPLPPYIERPGGATQTDVCDYQTIFASEPGAVAAPTASLHFTDRLHSELASRGIRTENVVLHVGPGTFLPVRSEHAEDARGHPMHAEWYAVPEATVRAVEEAKATGKRVVAVGTTCVRALEAWAKTGECRGETSLFIHEGHAFAAVDGIVTNFHLPRSTLLMMVCAFAGRERILGAYELAVCTGYRFYSFGDAMLLL